MLDEVVNLFVPSTHNSIRANMPVTLPVAWACTGELTVEPFAGLQMWTPAELGAEHEPAPTFSANDFLWSELSHPAAKTVML